jgi:hypothetical protein
VVLAPEIQIEPRAPAGVPLEQGRLRLSGRLGDRPGVAPGERLGLGFVRVVGVALEDGQLVRTEIAGDVDVDLVGQDFVVSTTEPIVAVRR